MRRKLKDNEVIIQFPNDNTPTLFKLSKYRSYQFKEGRIIGDTVFFWFGDAYCSVNIDHWNKIKKWSRNNKINNIL